MDNLLWTSAKYTMDQSPGNGDLLSDIFSETWILYADSIPRSTWQFEPRWTSRWTDLLGFFAIASMPEYIPHIPGTMGLGVREWDTTTALLGYRVQIF